MKWRVLAICFSILCAGEVAPRLWEYRIVRDRPDCAPVPVCDAGVLSGLISSNAMAEGPSQGTAASGSEQGMSISLAWDPSPNRSVTGYRIHYGAESGKYTKTLRVEGRLTTKATIKDLEKGKTYYFTITSLDAKGHESAFSIEVSNRPNGTPGVPAASHGKQVGSPVPPHSPGGATQLSRDGKIPPKGYPTNSEGKIAPSR